MELKRLIDIFNKFEPFWRIKFCAVVSWSSDFY